MHHILSFTGYIVSYIPATLISSMAWALTFLFFDILKVRRKEKLNNITIAFTSELTEKEKLKLAGRSYYEFCLTIFETLGSINPRVKRKSQLSIRTLPIISSKITRVATYSALTLATGNMPLRAFQSKFTRPV